MTRLQIAQADLPAVSSKLPTEDSSFQPQPQGPEFESQWATTLMQLFLPESKQPRGERRVVSARNRRHICGEAVGPGSHSMLLGQSANFFCKEKTLPLPFFPLCLQPRYSVYIIRLLAPYTSTSKTQKHWTPKGPRRKYGGGWAQNQKSSLCPPLPKCKYGKIRDSSS